MATNSLALRSRFRARQRICCRCRGPYDDDHICADRVRHPGVERFFLALRSLADHPSRDRIGGLLSGWLGGEENPVLVPPPLDDPDDVELAVEAFGVALIWANLPPSEQQVANAILQHAGYPCLEAA